MKILVDLNSKVDAFQISEVHKKRLCREFPQHTFEFADSYQHFKTRVNTAELALLWFFPEKLYKSAKNLQAMYTPAAGMDWLAEDPTGKITRHFSSFHGKLISESFISMLLYFNNQLAVAGELKNEQSWGRNAFQRLSLYQQKLLIVGCGNIGTYCGKAAQALGMQVCGVRRNPAKNNELAMIALEELHENIGEYDHVLNLLPGGEATDSFFNEALLGRIKKSACFYNFGRGTTVDEAALITKLQQGEIRAAGLDVTRVEPLPQDSLLWTLPNVLLTPHSSCCYEDYLDFFIDELRTKIN
ncbi:MAG: hypothetical protein HRT88_10810 [Lentisphaeraceae bacterium]|nr:hypothetical protein [Lentisphaeraceae bacterium]